MCTREDTANVSVYLGLGVYLNMPIDDAMVFLRKRAEMLGKKREVLIQKACHIKANIKLMYEVCHECTSGRAVVI